MIEEQKRHLYTHTGVNHEIEAEVNWYEINQFRDNIKKRLCVARKDDVVRISFDNYKSTDGVGKSTTQLAFEVPYKLLKSIVDTIDD